jgi:beta-1,4-mannosyl-glycoprotein beta-1,4-N-acetylglucosaminyltransferase
MIYDCFMFLNENDLLEIRINQHLDFVDKFIIIEAGQTHSGNKKTKNFDTKRFEKYADKIE